MDFSQVNEKQNQEFLTLICLKLRIYKYVDAFHNSSKIMR